MDNQPYHVPEGRDPLDISAYMKPEAQRHVIALGLIADATNENEATARSMVGIAVGLWEYTQIEAAFLGERIGTLARRMKALAEIEPKPDQDRDAACKWLHDAARLNERRDDILHRATRSGVVDDRVTQLLRRSRRNHAEEPLDDKAERLVADLFASVKEGKHLLVCYLTAEHERQPPR